MPTTVPVKFIDKMADFTEKAITELAYLQTQNTLLLRKQAEELQKEYEFEVGLKKIAQVLYDTDFITDRDEKDLFVKKAKEDHSYILSVFEKVCNASDVKGFGKVAKVKQNISEFDPVAAEAFGYNYRTGYSLIDEG